jgi:putative DNA primase/helicase
MQLLEEVFDHDAELIDFVQRAAGYTLTGDISEKLAFFCYGPADTGKSTVLNTFTDMMGTYATTKDFETLLLGRANLNATAGMEGIRLAVAGESRVGSIWNDAVLKRLTGGDTIEARRLYHESFNFRPQFKIWLASNDLPSLRDSTGAAISRIAPIPIFKTFARNGELAKELERELPGILAWAVQGAVRWHNGERLTRLPSASAELLEDYREEQDVVGWYLRERTSPGGPTLAGELYSDFKQWGDAIGLRTYELPNANSLGRDLKRRGFTPRHTKRGSAYELEIRYEEVP